MLNRNDIAKAIKKATKTGAEVKHLEVLVEMFLREHEYDEKDSIYHSYSLFGLSLAVEGRYVVTEGDFGTHIICKVDELPAYEMLS